MDRRRGRRLPVDGWLRLQLSSWADYQADWSRAGAPNQDWAAPLARPIRCERAASQAGKTLLRLNVDGTRRGDPHPHALSLACAAFFLTRDGVLLRLSPRTGRVDEQLQFEPAYTCAMRSPLTATTGSMN